MPFHQLAWQVQRTLRSLGWPGAVALLLAALCAAAWLLVLHPLDIRIGEVRHDARALRATSAVKPPAQPAAANSADELARFYTFFPPKSALSEQMTKLYAAAARHNLTLDQGEYRWLAESDGKLVRYEILLPVKGGYQPIRKFIAQALADVPSLSLEGVSFNRQKSSDAAVDAQIRFTLYLGVT